MGNLYLVTIPLVIGLALCALSVVVFFVRRNALRRISARSDPPPWVLRTTSMGPFLGSAILGLTLVLLAMAFLFWLA